MAKRESTPSRSQSQPRTPAGHFNSNGTSQGKQTGPVRREADACNEQKGKK